ncbi:MAG: hypothetical protein ACK55Z_26540, partial [bacterium]
KYGSLTFSSLSSCLTSSFFRLSPLSIYGFKITQASKHTAAIPSSTHITVQTFLIPSPKLSTPSETTIFEASKIAPTMRGWTPFPTLMIELTMPIA